MIVDETDSIRFEEKEVLASRPDLQSVGHVAMQAYNHRELTHGPNILLSLWSDMVTLVE